MIKKEEARVDTGAAKDEQISFFDMEGGKWMGWRQEGAIRGVMDGARAKEIKGEILQERK